MKKVILLFVVTSLLLPLVVTGCGVAQSEYEAVVADRDAAQAQVASLQADKSDVTSLFAALEKKLAATAMIGGFLSDAFKVVAGEMSQSDFNKAGDAFVADFGGVLDAVGNDALSQLWDDAVAASGRGDDEEFSSNLAALMDLLTNLIDEDISAINAKLG
jgi:hypothetical protein